MAGSSIRSRSFVRNPPWVTRAIADNFEALQAKVLPAYMPVLTDARASHDDLVVEVVELGCGAYGCVLPTDDKDVVLKITTDATEFELVSKILPEVGGAPEGLVRYYAWAELHGKVNLGGKGEHTAYALWRESASDIGELGRLLLEAERAAGGVRGGAKRQHDLLSEQQRAATEAYVLLASADNPDRLYMEAIHHHDDVPGAPLSVDPRYLRRQQPTARALALLINYFRACVAGLGEDRTAALALVGHALQHMFERGILVADVHTENVGRVKRGDQKVWVITDPGNVAVLPQPWPL